MLQTHVTNTSPFGHAALRAVRCVMYTTTKTHQKKVQLFVIRLFDNDTSGECARQ